MPPARADDPTETFMKFVTPQARCAVHVWLQQARRMGSRLAIAILAGLPLLGGMLTPARAQMMEPQASVRQISDKVSYQYLKTLELPELQAILGRGLDAFMAASSFPYQEARHRIAPPRFAVRLYKVSYESAIPEAGGRSVPASGLLALPATDAHALPLVSYQHGTVFERTSVPSSVSNSFETQLMLAVFASQGYAVIASDYLGLGDSAVPNTYGAPQSSVQACVALLHASRSVLGSMGRRASHLFVHGWSQGGYNTLAFLRRLESLGEKVTAASTAAAPTDVRLWVDRLMNNPQPGDAPWLVSAASNLLMAVDTYLLPGLAQRAIRPQYLELARSFYRFEIGFAEFFARTPHQFRDYLQPQFMESARLGEDDFWRGLDRQESYRWTASTPLRTYYGEVDEAVPVAIARLPALVGQILGSQTQAISAGPRADHRGAYVFSLPEVQAWHRQFLSAAR